MLIALGPTTEEYLSCLVAIQKTTRTWEMPIRISEIGTRRVMPIVRADSGNSQPASQVYSRAAAAMIVTRAAITKVVGNSKPTTKIANPERVEGAAGANSR
jgi:hypothetical protein